MTIHHDKLAYGKLASMRETVSQERIDEMLEKLKTVEEEDGAEKKDALKKDGRKKSEK